MEPHAILGIVQTICYVPVVPFAVYLLVRNAKRHSWRVWFSPMLFTIMRLAGGPVLIALGGRPYDLGLIIAATILLNVGVIPLLILCLGLFGVVSEDLGEVAAGYLQYKRVLRFCFVPAIVCLAAGSGIIGSSPTTAKALVVVGYCLFALILLGVIAGETHILLRLSRRLNRDSRMILTGTLVAAPFLVVRNVYGIVYAANEGDFTSIWNPVGGSTVLLALMALLMEYIVVWILFFVGISVDVKGRSPQH